MNPSDLLQSLFRAAVARAAPAGTIERFLPERPAGTTYVVGAGKAAASMAAAVEDAWGHASLRGVVVTRYAHGVPTRAVEVVEAGHPVPDNAGLYATRRIRQLVERAGADDLVLALMSGGASALLVEPAPDVPLEDKRAVTRALLASGAPIHEMNAVRKHLSAVKGGRLAALARPARLVTLAISDVPGDDADVIGSGPTVPDASTLADARAVLAAYGIEPPESVARRLADPAAETPKPGDPAFERADYHLIATPQQSLEAAAEAAVAAGVQPMILSDRIEGEAREVARALAGIALQVRAHGQPAPPPLVLLSGGETTVTVRGTGRGGRNAEFLLALALALEGADGIHALAADTDGIDGIEDNAGALIGPDTLARARLAGLDPAAYLANNDAYGFFQALDCLIVTGPTRTNVNDFRAILIS